MDYGIFSLKGKTALITGGYRGIGKAVAMGLARAGADIVLWDVLDATETAREIAQAAGVKAAAILCDVTDPQAVEEAMSRSAQVTGSLDILFNNAGIGPHKDALEVTPEEWRRVLDVNLNGIFYVATAFARYLQTSGKEGSVINTASMSGLIVNVPQRQASYNASKAAVIQLTKTLAIEWAEKGIRVNCISPGYIATDLIGQVREDWRKQWTDMIPFGRMGRPEELAGAVIYLASSAASYTSGCNIVIDGCYSVL